MHKYLRRTLLGASLLFFALFALFPFLWILATSLRPNAEMYNVNTNPLVVRNITFEHYVYLFTQTQFATWLTNSIIIALLSTAISIVAGVLASYSLGRLRYRGNGPIQVLVFATYLVPTTLLFIPLAYVVNVLGLTDSIWSLIVVYPTFLIPFIVWIMAGYFKGLPRELSESAMVDGATRLQTMYMIDLPLVLPGIVSVFFFAFTFAWNEYLYAFTFIRSDGKLPIAVAVVNSLQTGDIYFWGPLMAGAVLGSIPVVIIYSFLMDFYISGLTAGAVKG